MIRSIARYRFLLWMAAAGGCGGATPQECREQHPPSPLSSEAEMAASRAAEDCVRDGGSSCDRSRFISAAAAECIARADGLKAGIAPWATQLIYNYGRKTVIWGVRNTTKDLGRNGVSGDDVLIHATTGGILERGAWQAIP